MTLSLSSEQIKQRDRIAARMRDRNDELNRAVERMNERREELWSDVEEAVTAYNDESGELWGGVVTAEEEYNDAVHEANQWRESVVNDINEVIRKVEKFKAAFTGEFDRSDLHEPEDLNIDEPEPAEAPETGGDIDDLEGMPETVESLL